MYETRREMHENSLSVHDGLELFYRHWPAQGASQGAILLFHRGHEHGGRMAHLADELDLPDHDIFAWDARGNGRSGGARGDSPNFATSVRDVETFVRTVSDRHGIPMDRMAVVAQSVGAVLVSAWLHDYAPVVRAAVLASPAFSVKLYVPFAVPGLALLRKLQGNFFVNSYVKPKFLTHDPERIASYQADPLITRPISVNQLLGLYETADRVVADSAAITTPVQMFISKADWVVRRQPQDRFFENLGSAVKERHLLDGFFHDTLGERDRAPVVAKMRAFLLERFEQELSRPDLVRSHLEGFTRDESLRISEKLGPLSPRGLYWASQRLSIGFGGLISDGIRLGHETGFDSGSTLDYVYRNESHGKFGIGSLADRAYLDAIGWRGIRQRKVHLQEILLRAFDLVVRSGMPLRVADVGAGHGRYVLDAIGSSTIRPEAIRLRDFSPLNVEKGSALIRERNLQDIATFEQGDAFDPASVGTFDPAPTVAIVSGLYELFPDNDMVSRSLQAIAAKVPPGGLLAYTGQPWHPQLEMIARCLTSHRAGQAWVMRRRTQAEMDMLVERAGFEKIEQRIDEWGIFTVSLARRRAP
ncbi:MAG: alpha/beta fold hydrolase [Fibrobacteria bacterium]|nr:alpha/beta fold hydrolase [Fibrobacteria bacterium]